MKKHIDDSHSDDHSRVQELTPWWTSFVVAAVLGAVAFAALHGDWDDLRARWVVGGSAAIGFVVTGLRCLFERLSIRLDHFAGFQAMIFGAIALFFAVGLSVEDEIWQESFGTIAGMIGLTLWCGAMSIVGFGGWLNRPWGQRLNEPLHGLLSVAVLALFTWFALQIVVQAFTRRQTPSVAEVLLSELVLIWGVIGLLACFGSKRRGRLSAVADVLVMPWALLVAAPIPAGLVIAAIVLFSGAGELLGRALGMPVIGAFVGLALLVTVMLTASTYAIHPED